MVEWRVLLEGLYDSSVEVVEYLRLERLVRVRRSVGRKSVPDEHWGMISHGRREIIQALREIVEEAENVSLWGKYWAGFAGYFDGKSSFFEGKFNSELAGCLLDAAPRVEIYFDQLIIPTLDIEKLRSLVVQRNYIDQQIRVIQLEDKGLTLEKVVDSLRSLKQGSHVQLRAAFWQNLAEFREGTPSLSGELLASGVEAYGLDKMGERVIVVLPERIYLPR